MDIPQKLELAITRTLDRSTSTYHSPEVVNFENHTLHNFYLHTLIHEGNCIVPVFNLNNTAIFIDNFLFENTGDKLTNDFVYPLYSTASSLKKSGNSMLTYLFEWNGPRLTTVTYNDLTFTGGHGFIFKDRTPLFSTFLKLNVYIDKENPTKNSWLVTGVVVYIHPSVFTSNDLVSKAIIKKVIPTITSVGMKLPYKYAYSEFYSGKPEVKIQDISSMFVIPSYYIGNQIDLHNWNTIHNFINK
jgi:hypothetical protein